MAFHRQKQAELKEIINTEEKKSAEKINAIKQPIESLLAEKKKESENKYQLLINQEEKNKNPAIAKLEQKKKEIESLSDSSFQNLSSSLAVGKEIKDINIYYYYGESLKSCFFTFKTIAEIDKERGTPVKNKPGLCSCGKSTYKKTTTQTKKPIHCECTIKYIQTLQTYYKQPPKEKITPIETQIATLTKAKEEAIEKIKKPLEENIQSIEKEYQLSPNKKEEINKENQLLDKIILLFKTLETQEFQEKTILDIIKIKIGPPACNPDIDESDQPGLTHIKPAHIPIKQTNSDFKKSEKLLNALLKQAHRVHYDNSCLRRSGTPKASKILKALACCIIEIEQITNATDEIIYEKLKSACSRENLEKKNNNPVTIHHALREPRRSIFACCSLFGSTTAEKIIRETIHKIDHPAKNYPDALFFEATHNRPNPMVLYRLRR